jgi:hypothetical protein
MGRRAGVTTYSWRSVKMLTAFYNGVNQPQGCFFPDDRESFAAGGGRVETNQHPSWLRFPVIGRRLLTEDRFVENILTVHKLPVSRRSQCNQVISS